MAIVGIATSAFKARWRERTYYELAFDVASAALRDARMTKDDVGCCVYGIYNDFFERQFQPDLYVHDYLGMAPKPATRVSTGGATGGTAVRIGFSEVASGLYDTCLVLGVEKCADLFDYGLQASTPEALKAISYTADMTYEQPTGRTASASFALAVVSHQAAYGNPTEEQMARVSIKNHGNACLNPISQSPKRLSLDEVMKSRVITHPFKFYDNCLYSEGAAALILASEDVARRFTDKPVWITGIGAALDWAVIGSRKSLHEFEASRVAARKAYDMAGITNPLEQFDLAELHDAFTGTEILAYEDCFFCEPGGGGKLIDEGVVERNGKLPVNVSGGLIGCGHAVGATGIMQTNEIVLHLRGHAGERQVQGARRGLVQSIGGVGCAWTVCLVLESGQ
ncbi:MAG: thiolase family protein [Deltaproteobacteria bacterium]|nr:thiolase family protein [Deltaproteobacteria bacterium]